MTNPCPNDVIANIRLLLSHEVSQRETAYKTGVSRTMVQNVSQRKRGERDEPEPVEPGRNYPLKYYTRCPSCGTMSQLPCLACEVRKKNNV